jgi:hypothetical protein
MASTPLVGRAPSGLVRCLGSLLLCGMLAAPQLASARQPIATAEMVQQQVAAIDARSAAQKPARERPVAGVSAEGARVVSWGKPNAVEKISVEALGERGRVLQDFYWQRGALIAARERRIDYGANIMELPKDKPTPMNVVVDDWLEFAGQNLARRRSLEREMPKADTQATEQATRLKAEARSFKRLVSAPATSKEGECTWSCAREQRSECLAYSCK